MPDTPGSSRLPGIEPKNPATQDPPIVRLALISIALIFLALFLFVPVIAVFAQAFWSGLGAYFAAIVDPEARAAIRLTLMTAPLPAALDVDFGIASSWAIGRVDVRGEQAILTRIVL